MKHASVLIKPFYYEGVDIHVPGEMKKLPCTSWPKKLMVAIGIYWQGKSHTYAVPTATKITVQVLIKCVLGPMVMKVIPCLYGEVAKQV